MSWLVQVFIFAWVDTGFSDCPKSLNIFLVLQRGIAFLFDGLSTGRKNGIVQYCRAFDNVENIFRFQMSTCS